MLLTGDVASEGVNLHKQCHHLVHVDIPWSLIRIEQRNGRIDRYGQVHPPQITALALTTTDERFSGDVRVITKLLDKEHAAHTALGDAASLLDLHDVEREEDAIRKALAEGRDLDEVVPEPAQLTPRSSGLAVLEFLNAQAAATPPTGPRVATERRAVRHGARLPARGAARGVHGAGVRRRRRGGVGWREHPHDGVVELVPPGRPDDPARPRCRRATSPNGRSGSGCCWPPRARRPTSRLRAGPRRPRRPSGPTAHYLSPLHPVLDWAVDRALAQLGRNHVPVALPTSTCRPRSPWERSATDRGQVVLRSIVAQEFHDGATEPMVVEDVAALLDDSGFTKGGLQHRGRDRPRGVTSRWSRPPCRRCAARWTPCTTCAGRCRGRADRAGQAADRRLERAGRGARGHPSPCPGGPTAARRSTAPAETPPSWPRASRPGPDPMVRVLLLLLPRAEGQ